jgi:hypothetical protein
MPDARFFHRAGPFSLCTITVLIGTEPLRPDDAAIVIEDIAPLNSDARYAEALRSTRAGVIITSSQLCRRITRRGCCLPVIRVWPIPRLRSRAGIDGRLV